MKIKISLIEVSPRKDFLIKKYLDFKQFQNLEDFDVLILFWPKIYLIRYAFEMCY